MDDFYIKCIDSHLVLIVIINFGFDHPFGNGISGAFPPYACLRPSAFETFSLKILRTMKPAAEVQYSAAQTADKSKLSVNCKLYIVHNTDHTRAFYLMQKGLDKAGWALCHAVMCSVQCTSFSYDSFL